MSKLVLTRELVGRTERGFLGVTTRRLAWEASEGMCFWCGRPVPWLGSEVQYDHAIPLGLGGLDVLENIGPLHTRPCHLEKTQQDIRRIAKAKRQARLLGERKPSRRPLNGRGFLKHLTRGFDNLVRPRKPKEDRT